ncbi:LysM peptidoglycan-binding domain-containing protein [Candidatus Puniceispirillum marinum]|uniref:Peptidoglycan-binding LysM n=1 Tax=Puniceispirillum marinum (strain IMCC1322) TaxID=488538 RepID=D5BNR8_PUNMI|nr:Ig-like domain-containing protein [Candidatus Puniceispirillum marinum]ADE38335.1 Peptidoglycan-binding LysM [Candidatus Puniceispirillum marinum IMCC1322]
MRLKIFLLISVGAILAAFALGWVFLSDDNITAVEPQSAEVLDIPKPEKTAPEQDTAAPSQETTPTSDSEDQKTNDSASVTDDKTTLEIDIARVKPDGAAVFAGKAAPNAKIRVFEQDILLGETVADENGEWVVVLERPLAPGQHLVMIGMETEDGQSELADITLAIEIDDSESVQPLVALLPQTETDMPKLLQAPETEAETQAEVSSPENDAAMPLVAPRSIVWLDQERISIAGMSRGGVRLLVSLEDQKFADVAVSDQAGQDDHEWQVSGAVDMTKAGFEMMFNLLDENSQSVATYRLPLVTSDLQKGLDGSDLVIVQTGDALWRIAYRRYGEGVRYVDIVRQNAAAINDPDLIFPNQVFAVPE